MKLHYERVHGMTSIYRKLKKECMSFSLRLHVTTLILAVAMMVPAGVYADYTTAKIQSERRQGQAYDAGWADDEDNFVGQILQFEGHGVVQVTVDDGDGNLSAQTVHGSARLKVDTVGEVVLLEDCGQAFSSCVVIFSLTNLCEDAVATVELRGAFQQTNEPHDASQRGTLTLELSVPGRPCI